VSGVEVGELDIGEASSSDSGGATGRQPVTVDAIPWWHDVSGSGFVLLRWTWLCVLMVVLVYAECSLPAVVLGSSMVLLVCVRAWLALGLGQDLLGRVLLTHGTVDIASYDSYLKDIRASASNSIDVRIDVCRGSANPLDANGQRV